MFALIISATVLDVMKGWLCCQRRCWTRSTIEGGRGCNKFVPVLGRNDTKIAPIGDIFHQSPGGMSWIRGKLADHVGGHTVLSPEKGVFW